ncbi:MAG: PEGA domain-containing protein [Verrucomicrobia bacterium]|nr:PEGA domain-containing protein [Verrucomicrobiota bacterium]
MPTSAGVLAESDHTFWLMVETIPPGAAIFAVAETGEAGNQPIGHTPCTLAVDLNWGNRWFKKRWELLTVLSPDGFCRPRLQPDGGYQLTANLRISKEGWKPVPLERAIAVLANPGKDWHGKESWPTKQGIQLTLEPAEGTAAPPERITAGPRRVVMAGGGEGAGKVETGSVTVFSRLPDAEVFVDDQPVGAAPVELRLRAGRHVVEVRAADHSPSRREFELAPDAALSFEAAFSR